MQTEITELTTQRQQVLHSSNAVNKLVDDLTLSISTLQLSPASGQVTSAVTHNIAGYSSRTFPGDHRYPPIIPPSNNGENNRQSKGASLRMSMPDRNVELAATMGLMSKAEIVDAADSDQAFARLMSLKPGRNPQQELVAALSPSAIAADTPLPAAAGASQLRDPEYLVTTCEIRLDPQAGASVHRSKLLTNREANDRWGLNKAQGSRAYVHRLSPQSSSSERGNERSARPADTGRPRFGSSVQIRADLALEPIMEEGAYGVHSEPANSGMSAIWRRPPTTEVAPSSLEGLSTPDDTIECTLDLSSLEPRVRALFSGTGKMREIPMSGKTNDCFFLSTRDQLALLPSSPLDVRVSAGLYMLANRNLQLASGETIEEAVSNAFAGMTLEEYVVALTSGTSDTDSGYPLANEIDISVQANQHGRAYVLLSRLENHVSGFDLRYKGAFFPQGPMLGPPIFLVVGIDDRLGAHFNPLEEVGIGAVAGIGIAERISKHTFDPELLSQAVQRSVSSIDHAQMSMQALEPVVPDAVCRDLGGLDAGLYFKSGEQPSSRLSDPDQGSTAQDGEALGRMHGTETGTAACLDVAELSSIDSLKRGLTADPAAWKRQVADGASPGCTSVDYAGLPAAQSERAPTWSDGDGRVLVDEKGSTNSDVVAAVAAVPACGRGPGGAVTNKCDKLYGRPRAGPEAYRRPAGDWTAPLEDSKENRLQRASQATGPGAAGAHGDILMDPVVAQRQISHELGTEGTGGSGLSRHNLRVHCRPGERQCLLRHSKRRDTPGELGGLVSARIECWSNEGCGSMLPPLSAVERERELMRGRRGAGVMFGGLGGKVTDHIAALVRHMDRSHDSERKRRRRNRNRRNRRRASQLGRGLASRLGECDVSMSKADDTVPLGGEGNHGGDKMVPREKPLDNVSQGERMAWEAAEGTGALEVRADIDSHHSHGREAGIVAVTESMQETSVMQEGKDNSLFARAVGQEETVDSSVDDRNSVLALEGWTDAHLHSVDGTALLDVELPGALDVVAEVGREKRIISVQRDDWECMEGLGFQLVVPGTVIALAYRRQVSKSVSAIIRLRDRYGQELRGDSEPGTWADFVCFVRSGGSCVLHVRMRGGMDPAQQAMLDATVFDDTLDYAAIDSVMTGLRSGIAVPDDTDPQLRRLAEALASVLHLQQWNPLDALPEDVKRDCICSPARLAALQCIAQRHQTGTNVGLPGWVTSGQFLEVRFNEIPELGIHLDNAAGGNGRAQLQDTVIRRVLTAVPGLAASPHFNLAEMRDSMRPECNLQLGAPFSATMVIPVGPWIPDLLNGRVSIGGESFCTVTAVGTHVEVILSKSCNQLLRAIRGCLGVSRRAFHVLLNDSLQRALLCPFVMTRSTTSRVVNAGKKRTVENFDSDSDESAVMIGLEATRLLMVRRDHLDLQVRLGHGRECPVGLRISCPQCPHGALMAMLEVRTPPPLRFRPLGTLPESQIMLIGPLPRGWTDRLGIPASANARILELQRDIAVTVQGLVGASTTRLIGRYDRRQGPMFVYLEFGSLELSQSLARNWDAGTCPDRFRAMWQHLVGDVSGLRLWSSGLMAEALAVASDKTWKELVALGEAHPCTPPPAPPGPPPPAPAHAAAHNT